MIISCEKCGAEYNIDASKIPDKGAKVKCRKCSNLLYIKKDPSGISGQPKTAKEGTIVQECIKCGYKYLGKDKITECPKCGVIYKKAQERAQREAERSKAEKAAERRRNEEKAAQEKKEKEADKEESYRKSIEEINEHDHSEKKQESHKYFIAEKENKVTKKEYWIQQACIVFISIAIFFGIIAGVLSSTENDRPSSSQSNLNSAAISGDVHGAWAYMQLFVEERLKSPKSADFPFGGYRHVQNLGNDRYKIVSYVDAQNSYGATIRTHFDGVIKKVNNGWQLEYLNFK